MNIRRLIALVESMKFPKDHPRLQARLREDVAADIKEQAVDAFVAELSRLQHLATGSRSGRFQIFCQQLLKERNPGWRSIIGRRRAWIGVVYGDVRANPRRHKAPATRPVEPVQPHVTGKVDEIWGTDMTQTVTTGEGRTYVFIAVDHCSGEFVGTHAARARPAPRPRLELHVAGLPERDRLASSPAFVRQPEGNGVAERAIRTLKEQLLWVRHFATVEELRLALAEFAALYNASWLRQRHGHKTPDQIRAEQKGLWGFPNAPSATA